MGKTAVFILSVLHQLDDKPRDGCAALILCNVRELAHQIKKEVDRFTKHMPDVLSEVFYGGVPIKENEKVLKGVKRPHIIIGTPGRILALVNRKALKLDQL